MSVNNASAGTFFNTWKSSTLPSNAVCKSVWSDKVPVTAPQTTSETPVVGRAQVPSERRNCNGPVLDAGVRPSEEVLNTPRLLISAIT